MTEPQGSLDNKLTEYLQGIYMIHSMDKQEEIQKTIKDCKRHSAVINIYLDKYGNIALRTKLDKTPGWLLKKPILIHNFNADKGEVIRLC